MISLRQITALFGIIAALIEHVHGIDNKKTPTHPPDYLQQGREALQQHIHGVLEEERRLAREREELRLRQECLRALNAENPAAALPYIRAGVSPELRSAQGHTALQQAARLGHTELVAALLEAGAGADPAAHGGIQPLLYAIMGSHTDCVRLLLRNGASPNAEPGSGCAPLVHAIMCRQDESVQLLLQHGATPSAEAMLKATLAGRADYVQSLLAAGGTPKATGEFPAPGFASGPRQGTLLIAAAERGYTDIVDLLLAAGADINAVDENGRSALLRSIVNGRLTMAQKLIEAGADVTLRSRVGTTALMAAARQGNLRLYQHIVRKGGLEEDTNNYGESMLMYAAMGGHCELIRHLVSNGADIKAQAGDRATALHYAIEGGHYDAAKLLLQLGADPNSPWVKADASTPPLYLAVRHNRRDLVDLLLEHGAKPLSHAAGIFIATLPEMAAAHATPELYTYLLPLCGETEEAIGAPLLCAVGYGNDTMVRFLAAKGENINDEFVLRRAVYSGQLSTVRTLIELGADVKQYGAPALAYACSQRSPKIATLLLEHNAPVDGVFYGLPTLMHAAQWGEQDFFETLLTRVKNPNAHIAAGRNAAHYAAKSGHPGILRALAAQGVSLTLADKYGNTPLILACKNHHTETMRTLCKLGAPFPPAKNRANIWETAINSANVDMVRTLLELGAKATDPCGYTHKSTAALYAEYCARRSDCAAARREILRLLTGYSEPRPYKKPLHKNAPVIYEAVRPQK